MSKNSFRFPSLHAIATAQWAKLTRVQTVVARGSKRYRAEERLVEQSTLFDREWYLRTYPDIATAAVDPLRHYMTSGWREGRDPSAQFATSKYLRANPDVARSGANPLVHYIEFGHAEGREAFGHRPSFGSQAPVSWDFAAAAPCASFPLPVDEPVAWRRSYRLDRSDPDSVTIGDVVVGYSRDADVRRDVENAGRLLEVVSGTVPELSSGETLLPTSAHRLVDAWYLNRRKLRTRWSQAERPFVVRAFQSDPKAGGGVALVGESAVYSPVDFVDLDLRNGLFPVLFVFADAAGEVLGARLLGFPSLCRGGSHYPELLRADVEGPDDIDVLAQSDTLTRRLLDRFADGAPAIGGIAVDLHGADASTPLFQSDFREWLQKVMRISVRPLAEADETLAAGFLAETIRLAARDSLRSGGGTLVIASDMVPTISALTEARGQGEATADKIVLPLFIAAPDPSQPALLANLPSEAPMIMDPLAIGKRWPMLVDAAADRASSALPPAAIRLNRGERLTDAQILLPVSDSDLISRSRRREAITWLVEPGSGDRRSLAQALECIALQNGGAADRVVLVGAVGQAETKIAQQSFGGQVDAFPDLRTAAKRLDTPSAAFVGVSVLVHDARTAELMCAMLEGDFVSSASCVLVRADRRGKAWHATVVDAGVLPEPTRDGRGQPTDPSLLEQFWRATFPVAAPPRDFWVARSAHVEAWLDGAPAAADELHLCSFLVTASYAGDEPRSRRNDLVPRAADSRSISLEVLFG